MSEDTKRKGPIAFRMNQEDYNKFINYVESTDLSKSKIAERAARDYVTENTDTLRDRLASAAVALLALGYPTVAAYAGRPDTAAAWVALVVCYLLFQPQIDHAIDRLPNPLN